MAVRTDCTIWIPRRVDAMDVVILFGSFLILLGLDSENEGGQSQSKQYNLNQIQTLKQNLQDIQTINRQTGKFYLVHGEVCAKAWRVFSP